MVSFFGEVVFPSSRALWDDDDENGSIESTVHEPNFSVRWLTEKPTHIKTLMMIESQILLDSPIMQYLNENTKAVCAIEDKEQLASTIHQVNDDVYLCSMSHKFNVKFSSLFIEKISDILSSVECTVSITCCHVSQFKSNNVPDTPSFLRMLNTKSGENFCKLKEPFLEQPNIVFGVGAGVLSYAEFMGLPSILYILYTDSFVLDSISAEPVLRLLRIMNCVQDDVKFRGEHFFKKGNLYM